MEKQMLISLPHAETYSFPSDVNMWQLIGNALCSSYGWWYTLSIFVRSTVMDGESCTHNSIICIRWKRWRKLHKKKEQVYNSNGNRCTKCWSTCTLYWCIYTFSILPVSSPFGGWSDTASVLLMTLTMSGLGQSDSSHQPCSYQCWVMNIWLG